MITADTITDEQIRELMRSIAGRVFPASGMAHTGASDVWHVCQIALGEAPPDGHYDGMSARTRLAEIINARSAK